MVTDKKLEDFCITCCRVWQVDFADIRAPGRARRECVVARKALTYLLRTRFEPSWSTIGRLMRRDHSTAISNFRSFEAALRSHAAWAVGTVAEIELGIRTDTIESAGRD